ncbi:hypothetical protein A3Q56_01901 [Intoshia linei]|uniref:Uncharacterized protein n=1 Tax=Intoshia linei TaxID=1819745 RepID=A0A177BA70_9BILA|nr:hypothetical protein A3Q56_01901 [Intoshia linei]
MFDFIFSEYKDSQSYEFVVLTQSYWYKLKINNKKGKTSHGDEWIWKIGMKTKLAYPIHVFVGFMDSKAAIIIIQLINGYFNIYQQETLILSFCITGIVNKAPFCFNQNITSDFKNDCLYLAKNNNLVAISFKTINAFNKKVINETKFAWSYKVSKEIMQLKLNDSKKCIYVLKNLQEMILICDSNNRLIIMDNFTVKWIATYETVGIEKIKVLNIGKLNGVIFTIDSTGLVKLNIAKTNIKINNVFNQKNEDFDINYAAKNYAKYKSIIDNSDIMTENTEKPKKFLKIDVEKSEITQVEGHLMLRITVLYTLKLWSRTKTLDFMNSVLATYFSMLIK